MRDVDALVAELRERAASYRLGGPSSEHTAVLLDKAADALESERSRVDRLEKALKAVAESNDMDNSLVPGRNKRRARAALGKEDVSD
jgi:hypothetical protein